MGDHIKLSIKSPNRIPKTTVDREHISVNVVILCASKRKQCLLFKFKWCESNVLVNFVCSYFVSRSFTKLLLCSQIKAPFGLTPSSEDCGPKPKLKGQRLGTVWLLGIIRIEEKKNGSKWPQHWRGKSEGPLPCRTSSPAPLSSLKGNPWGSGWTRLTACRRYCF